MMLLRRFRNYSAAFLAAALLVPVLASAHVVVTPSSVGIGAEQLFSVSVPNEKDSAVTQVKLDIPAGVQDVTPTEKPGWTIALDTSGSGDQAITKSITWSGNLVVGLRDDFSFSAQAPAKTTSLAWKAYQTYADGSSVHWDQVPAGSDDATGDAGPYSVTKVVNDLAAANADTTQKQADNDTLPLVLSVVALLLAATAVFRKNPRV